MSDGFARRLICADRSLARYRLLQTRLVVLVVLVVFLIAFVQLVQTLFYLFAETLLTAKAGLGGIVHTAVQIQIDRGVFAQVGRALHSKVAGLIQMAASVAVPRVNSILTVHIMMAKTMHYLAMAVLVASHVTTVHSAMAVAMFE